MIDPRTWLAFPSHPRQFYPLLLRLSFGRAGGAVCQSTSLLPPNEFYHFNHLYHLSSHSLGSFRFSGVFLYCCILLYCENSSSTCQVGLIIGPVSRVASTLTRKYGDFACEFKVRTCWDNTQPRTQLPRGGIQSGNNLGDIVCFKDSATPDRRPYPLQQSGAPSAEAPFIYGCGSARRGSLTLG